MKTSDFDHIIREALLNDARTNDPAAENARERVWAKANPPTFLSQRSVFFRIAVAALLASFITGGTVYIVFQSTKKSNMALSKKSASPQLDAYIENNQPVRIVHQNHSVDRIGRIDTVIIEKPLFQDVYITIVDTVYKNSGLVTTSNISTSTSLSSISMLPIQLSSEPKNQHSLWRNVISSSRNTAKTEISEKRNRFLPIRINLPIRK